MKKNINVKILSLLLFFIPFIQNIYSQGWTAQNSGISNYITSVCFINGTTGWAAAEQGKILKTTNGGTNWQQLQSGTSNSLNTVQFIDENTGWLSGSGGIILKSTNGGINWQQYSSSASVNIFFTDAATGYGTGGSGAIVKSTNGGANWFTQSSGTTEFLTDCCFINNTTGWISGFSGIILKTTNGGDNWVNQPSGTGTEFFSVFFINSSSGWAVGGAGNMRRTTNGGANWLNMVSPTGEDLLSVYFINNNTGWVSGNGTVMVTTNSGTNWAQQTIPTSNSLNAVVFSGIKGWAVGLSGTIISTNSAGFSLPSAPGNLNATPVSNSQINISWSDSSNNEQYFKIERSLNAATWTLIDSVNANVTSYQNTGLSGGTLYHYRVYSSAWFGSSAPTTSVSARTIPDSPVLVSPPNNSTGISVMPQLQWNSSTGASSYRLQISSDSLFASILVNDSTLTGTSYTVGSGILLNNVKYFWRVSAKNTSGVGQYSEKWSFTTGMVGVNQAGNNVPKEFRLYNNYPNPFNPLTRIKFDIPEASFTSLVVYDITGKQAAVLVNKELQPGSYQVDFIGSNFSSGVYFYRLNAGDFTKINKMILVK